MGSSDEESATSKSSSNESYASAKSCFNGSMRSVDSINNDGKCISIHHHRHRHHNGHLADTVLSTDQPFYPACSSFAPPTPTVIETGGKKF
ncbi:hypothetical protein BCIN_11g02550 [Botrytis cinerea B05.10]|uniref:Uncharacterized protein n=1 Tax=Botryotinia fuckeliana (strain B05.10) TaxID=332648 RepID=A0A384JWJ0_BOTFB|nr:hypothetical protein BCIN_11g02550 [Botrytis cinerea B05.10]ATZ54943.1 hypothetical protein BCIN_11g02550 [Botrytis cinerea B05.10]